MRFAPKARFIRFVKFCLLSALVLTLLGPSYAQSQLPPLADSWNGIHLFLNFDPVGNYTDSYIQSIATRFDYGFSSGRFFYALKTGNPSFVNTLYRDSVQAVEDQCAGMGLASNCTDSQVLSWYQTNHPDWVLYRCDKVTPLRSYDYNALIPDFSNPDYVNFKWNWEFAPRITTITNLQGVALDNAVVQNDFFPSLGFSTYGHACGVYDAPGHWVQKFVGITSYADVLDPPFTDAFTAYLAELRRRLHALANPRLLTTNTYPKVVYTDAVRRANLISAVDAILIQGGDYGPETVGDPRKIWLNHIHFVEDMNAAGKGVYDEMFYSSVSTESAIPAPYVRFVLASYLLAKGHHAALKFSTAGAYITDSGIYWPAEAETAHNGTGVSGAVGIGTPCAAMVQIGGITGTEDALFMREYTGGVSVVNASLTTSYTATLPSGRTYKDLYNNSVASSLTIPPTTGNIFLKTSGATCSNGLTTTPTTSTPTATAPVISAAGPNQTVTLPDMASLTTTATGSGTLSYQWSVLSGTGPTINNGIYKYSANPDFPTDTYHACNYWVDVAFVPTGGNSSAPASLWTNSLTAPSSADPNAIEIGMKFKSDVNGSITGIRFFKGTQNTGTHTVSLWDSGGTLLARTVASNETASGWQQVNFSSPVNISANTVYIASYHTTSGYYSSSANYFTSQYDNGSLHGLADVASAGIVTFTSSNSANTQASFSAAGTYTLRVTVTDGQLSSTKDVVVTVNPSTTPISAPVVTAPVVSAGTNQTITLPSTATLSATASGGAPGSTLTYHWTVLTGTGVTLTAPNSASTQASFSAAGNYTFRMTVSDGQLSSTADVGVTVNPAPAPLSVSVGQNQIITLPNTATLIATASGGASGVTLTYRWTVLSGTGVTLTTPNSASTQALFSAAGNFTFRATVSNGQASATADLGVTVNPAPLLVSAGQNQTIALPNTATLTATASGGAPGSTLTYRWTVLTGTGVTLTAPTSSSTQASFSTTGTYTFRVAVGDGHTSATADITVTVTEPSLTLVVSRSGDVLKGNNQPIRASYNDPATQRLELLIDGQTKATVIGTSLSYAWNTKSLSGSHTIKAIAYSSQGIIATKSITVTVY